MDADEFKQRTKALAIRMIRLVESLPDSQSASILGRQLFRSATSVGANYRAACRARSRADMVHKLGIVEEEADETLYWLEILGESGMVPTSRLGDLTRETQEILAMTVASKRTLRRAQIENRKSKIENPNAPA